MTESNLPRMGNWRYYLISVPCAALGLVGILRLASAVREWGFLVELGVRPGPLWIAIGGALWGLLGFGAVVLAALRPRGDWNRPAVFLAMLLAAILHWVDFLGFTRPREMLVNWPFGLAVTVLGLVYFFFVLRLPLWWRTRKEAGDGK